MVEIKFDVQNTQLGIESTDNDYPVGSTFRIIRERYIELVKEAIKAGLNLHTFQIEKNEATPQERLESHSDILEKMEEEQGHPYRIIVQLKEQAEIRKKNKFRKK